MNRKKQFSYFTTAFGKIMVNIADDGVVLTQEGRTGAIALGPRDLEKLAKGLFAVRKKHFASQSQQNKSAPSLPTPQPSLGKSYMEQQKSQHAQAYAHWTPAEEERLKKYHSEGKTTSEIAKLLGRNDGSITSRKAKLGLS